MSTQKHLSVNPTSSPVPAGDKEELESMDQETNNNSSEAKACDSDDNNLKDWNGRCMNTGMKPEMPNSVLSLAVIIAPAIGRWNWASFFLIILPVYCLAGISVASQFAAVYYVREINGDRDTTTSCQLTPHNLRLVVEFAFTILIWVEVRESIAMILYVISMPTARTWSPAWYKRNMATKEICRFSKGAGMTLWYKWVIFVVVLLPKMALAGAIWYYGSVFLLSTASVEDLLLNAVALTFVLEIDDYIYKVVPNILAQGANQPLPLLQQPSKRNLQDDSSKSSCSCLSMIKKFHTLFGLHLYTSFCVAATILMERHVC